MKEQEREEIFRFKQFGIKQNKCIMKVGTDGTLLGAWCGQKNTNHVLDIGTGTGLIAMMVAQRFPSAQIDALEYDVQAFSQAKDNFGQPFFEHRIHAIHGDFKAFVPNKKYDTIVSNPPFFSANPGKANSQERASARQQVHLNWASLVQGTHTLLKDSGVAYLVLPDQHKSELEYEVDKVGLHIHKWCAIQGHNRAPIKRWMVAFGKEEKETLEENLILRNSEGKPSQEYQNLCKDFYLKW